MEATRPREEELEFLRRTNEGLRDSLARVQSFQEISRRFLSLNDRAEVCRTLVEEVRRAFRPTSVELYLYEADREAYALFGEPAARPLLPEAALLEWLTKEPKPTTVPLDEERFVTVVPLAVYGQWIGVLCLDLSNVGEMMTQNDTDILAELGTAAAVSILNSDLLARVHRHVLLLQNVLDSITNGILVLDREGRVRRLNRNAMAMLGLDPDVERRPVMEVLTGSVHDVVQQMVQEMEQTGFAMERMAIHKLATGQELPLAVSLSLLLDEGGQKSGMIVIFRDMTASKELDRLRKIDQMKSEFVANVSHELKTPLTSIRAYTEALQDMADMIAGQAEGLEAEKGESLRGTAQQAKEFLNVVIEEADRLLALINDLLNVARIQAGKLKLNIEKVDPRLIVTEILKMSKVQSEKHKLVVELADGLPMTCMDKEKLKEVVINLVSNAIKYSPKGGNVYIRMNLVESNLKLDVQDEGIGIAPEHLTKVFEQFFRVDSSLTYEVPGTGLGLAIVRAIIDAHGGKVEVSSELGKGSTFTIWIPIRTEWRPEFDLEESFVD